MFGSLRLSVNTVNKKNLSAAKKKLFTLIFFLNQLQIFFFFKMNFDRNKGFPNQEKKNEGANRRQGDRNETELDLSPIPCLPNISSYPNARFPGSTPA